MASAVSLKNCIFSMNRDEFRSAEDSPTSKDSIQSPQAAKFHQKKGYLNKKKKTELCKNYSLGLVCPYGDQCSFAHGQAELKTRLLVSPHYKTKKCRNFHIDGYCHFGSRCQFLHEEDTARSGQLPAMSYTRLLETLGLSHYLKPEQPVDKLICQSLSLSVYKIGTLPIFQAFINN